mgnify:CR=1 FL=1
MPLHRRYQYISTPFTPLHDWDLTGFNASGRVDWLPVFADFARAAKRQPYLMGGTIEPIQQLILGEIPPPELSWLAHYPDIVRANVRRPHLQGGDVDTWLSLGSFAPPGLSWLPDFPASVYRRTYHPAYNPPYVATLIVPLTDVAQFPMLYIRQPDFAKVWESRIPHLLPFFTRRTQDLFGVWTEPGVTPVVSSWTEPGITPIVTSWTEPGVTPITSTWTEPAVTPITPSPDIPT